MKKLSATILFIVWASFCAQAQITIEDCVSLARDNYPAVRKYELLKATNEIDLSDINKSWLPRIDAYAQISGQNAVPSFPKPLTGMLEQIGQKMKGLGKIQYKAGVDLNQTIWDGGASGARREIARARTENGIASLDVELYGICERVENLYFAILLTEMQIAQNEITHRLLTDNLEKIRAMHRNGTAMQSDADMVEAQALTLRQAIAGGKSALKGYRDALGIFIGKSLDDIRLIKPSASEPTSAESARPELRMFETRLRLTQLSDKLSKTTLMPKIGFFAQAYYGYPGFDYFKSMSSRNPAVNIMAGVKASWNIDAFYTRRNTIRKTQTESESILADRDLFLFNTDLQSASQRAAIQGIRSMISDDAQIIRLRANVRKAAESQLSNGIIDATALLAKIADENMARLAAQLHELQLLQEIYRLKYTLNR